MTHVRRQLLTASCLALLGVAVFFRIWKLDHIPGVNGDEAWYGVNALLLLRGEGSPAWSTPTKNPLNPFYFLPVLALHSWLPPSVVSLRATAVLSGLLALAANYWLCRRVFDGRTATVSTLLLAVLPINIAYSRFGWDPSQTLLATVLVLHSSLLMLREAAHARRWLLWCAAACGMAAWVHPTNVFILVFPLIAIGYRRQWSRAVQAGLVALAGIGLVLAQGHLAQRAVFVSWERLWQPDEMLFFLRDYGRLFSGITVYRYIPGSCQRAPFYIESLLADFSALDGLVILLWISVVVCLWRHIRRHDGESPADRLLLSAGAISLIVFYVMAGPAAMQPHYERYSLWMIAPGTLVLARTIALALEGGGRTGAITLTGTLLTCTALLACFSVNYFRFFETTGGVSHRTFRTAATEPKLAALRHVLAQRSPRQPVLIVSDDWGNYWPIRYLAMQDRGVAVSMLRDASAQPDWKSRVGAGQVWLVQYAGADDVSALKNLNSVGLRWQEHHVKDYAGKALLEIIHPRGLRRR